MRVTQDPYHTSVAINVSLVDQTLATPSRALYVGTAGNLVCRLSGDSADVTLTGLAAGIYPLAVKIIRHTSTTAAAMVALY